ncbi:hypothetical protein KFU94_07770 [Chloroflexi bacterium TSY]|nr:hypothetical protein [Chloroflexi bacterium TSY]
MMIYDRPPHYRVYLLTVWQERSGSPDHPGVWRFSLEDPHSKQRRGFVSVAALVAALQEGALEGEDEPVKEKWPEQRSSEN